MKPVHKELKKLHDVLKSSILSIYYLIKIITAGKTVIRLALQEMLMEPI